TRAKIDTRTRCARSDAQAGARAESKNIRPLQLQNRDREPRATTAALYGAKLYVPCRRRSRPCYRRLRNSCASERAQTRRRYESDGPIKRRTIQATINTGRRTTTARF